MTSLICPACSSSEVRIAAVHSGDGFIHRFFYHPYRCRKCRHRFWLRSNPRIVAVVIFLVMLLAMVALGAWLSQDGRPPRYSPGNDLVGSLHKRAKANDAEAQVQLARIYDEGDGVLRNQNEAVRLYELAAKSGNREGQYHYAMVLMEGRGMIQDYRAAFKWLEVAAKGGHPSAAFQLGRMYYKGMGIPVDKAKAYIWFNVAAAQGNEEASRIRDIALKQIPPGQVNEAQEAARKLHAELTGLPGVMSQQETRREAPAKEAPTSLKPDNAIREN